MESSIHKNKFSFFKIIEEKDITSGVKCMKLVNNYLLLKKIGKGTWGKVFISTDIYTKKNYAIKKINLKDLFKTQKSISQFIREIKLMKSLEHPNILKLEKVLVSLNGNYAYLILKLAEHGSVDSLIKQNVNISLSSILSIIKQISYALMFIHSKEYVHHDIKPGNILIDADGKALLSDFGIGHSFKSALSVVGSPAFQAPEALDDNDDNQKMPQEEDVWALGVTLYQMIFKKLPFKGSSLYEIISTIKSKKIDIPEDSPEIVKKLLNGMLSIDQSKRLKSSECYKLLKEFPDKAEIDYDCLEIPECSLSNPTILIKASEHDSIDSLKIEINKFYPITDEIQNNITSNSCL